MNKKLIRLTESDLHKIVKESVDKILKEMDLNPRMNMNTFDAHGRGLTSKSHMSNSPRRRAAKLQQNINDVKIDINAIARQLYPDHTPQMAKDQLKRKLYGESLNQFLKGDVDYGIPPYTVVVGGLREGKPFDDIYDAIEYAEQWHNYITNSGEHENITIYDGNDEDIWSVGHFRK